MESWEVPIDPDGAESLPIEFPCIESPAFMDEDAIFLWCFALAMWPLDGLLVDMLSDDMLFDFIEESWLCEPMDPFDISSAANAGAPQNMNAPTTMALAIRDFIKFSQNEPGRLPPYTGEFASLPAKVTRVATSRNREVRLPAIGSNKTQSESAHRGRVGSGGGRRDKASSLGS